MTGERKSILWALVAILLWGTLAAVVGDALTNIPPATLVLYALAFAAPTLIAIDLLRQRSLRSIFVARPPVIAIGLLGIFGYHALFFVALAKAPLIEANLLNYLWPLFMVLLAPLLTKERLTPVLLGGAVLGFLGAALVVTHGRALDLSPEHALGYGLAALAALTWSSFSVGLKRLGPEGEDRMALFVTASLVPALAFAALEGGLAPPTGRALAACAWLGIGPMGIAFFCWNRALSRGSAARIGTLSYLDPLLSTLVLAAYLRTPPDVSTWVGMALIVGGAAAPSLRRVK
jgi:drug/metabolite transporter (DMT)-like permease